MRNLLGRRPSGRAASPTGLIATAVRALAWTAILAMAVSAQTARPNLAAKKICKASSVEGKLTPDLAVDGPKSQGSRWGSNYGSDKNKDSAWLFVDLGKAYDVDSVAIYWEHSGAKRYDIQSWASEVDTPSYSDAGWKVLLTDTTLYYQPRPVDMCLSFLKLAPARARYLRVRCYKRMFEFGFSIMELEVYGKESAASALVPFRNAARAVRPERTPGSAWGLQGRFFTADGRALAR